MIHSTKQTMADSPSMNRKVFWMYLLLLFISYIVYGKTYIGQSKDGKKFLISTKHRKTPDGPSNLHFHKKKILKIHKSKNSSSKHAKKKKLSKDSISKETGIDYAEAGHNYAEEGNDYAETEKNNYAAHPLGSIYTSSSSIGITGNMILFKTNGTQ